MDLPPAELLLDVMGTLVYDPFYVELPRVLGMSFDEMLAAKHPTAWAEFERGERTEQEFLDDFFADGRSWPGERMKECMTRAYRLLDGVEELLDDIVATGRRPRLVSNYPHWYRLVEERTGLSRWADWTFVSCNEAMRKPDEDVYRLLCERLNVPAEACLFVDDSEPNIAAAAAFGMDVVRFENADSLRRDLVERGVLEKS